MMMGAKILVVGVLDGPEIPFQVLKWLVAPDVGRAQFLVIQSLQKTLVGLAFALAVARLAPV
jgi:hypothetical protein